MRSLWLATRSGGRPRETDVPSPEPEATAQARLSGPDENESGAKADRPAASQGPQAAGCDDTAEVASRTSGRFRFPRSARIRRSSEIRALFRRGERKRTGQFDVFVAAAPSSRTRLALIVPKHGRSIVERNRLKRHLREAVRLQLLPACRDSRLALDIAIRAKPGAYDMGYEEVENQIGKLVKELCSRSSSS